MLKLKNIEKEYNAKIYVVGGCLRDICLNIPVHDIDITAENIEYTKLAKILGKYLKSYAVAFKDNMRIMKTKIIEILREHPGLRKREIASYLDCHHFKILKAICLIIN